MKLKARHTLVAVVAVGLAAASCSTTVEETGGSTSTIEASSSTASTAASTTAAPTTTAGAGGVMDGVPDLSGASKQRTDSISDGGTHVYYTTSEAPSAVVSGYASQLTAAGWATEDTGGGGSSSGGGAGLAATNGSRHLVLEAGGPSGETFIDLCVWPSEPTDDSCGDPKDEDEDEDE